jgi:hypothetical protein
VALYEVQFVDVRGLSNRDATAAHLRVHRDGEYFQFVAVVASGIELLQVRQRSIAVDRFWAHFVPAAVELVKGEVREGTMPLADPTEAFWVRPIFSTALSAAEKMGAPPALREGDVVGTFEL